jgi:hypothetical protein
MSMPAPSNRRFGLKPRDYLTQRQAVRRGCIGYRIRCNYLCGAWFTSKGGTDSRLGCRYQAVLAEPCVLPTVRVPKTITTN